MSCTLGPVVHGRVGWVFVEGWQRYWADGAADEAVAWSPADGLMGGGFAMVRAMHDKASSIIRYYSL
jgi:hypothetical protein